MSFFSYRFRCIAALALALSAACAHAQSCYFPDGSPATSATPCTPTSKESACCGSDQFCLVGGLCFGGGVVTRGSCTDSSWKDAACSPVCTQDDRSSEAPLTPCSIGSKYNSFVCGINTTDCRSESASFSLPEELNFILRPNQVAELVQPVLATAQTTTTATVTADASGTFTGGQMAGLAIGIAIPFIIALGVMFLLLRQEKRRFSKPKLMYKLPPEVKEEYDFYRPHPSQPSLPGSQASLPIPTATEEVHVPLASPSMASSGTRSRAESLRSRASARPVPKQQPFVERYETMRHNSQIQEAERHELDSTPTSMIVERFELGVNRMS